MGAMLQCHDCGIYFDEDEQNDGGFVNTLCPACVAEAEADRLDEVIEAGWKSLPSVRDALAALAESKEV